MAEPFFFNDTPTIEIYTPSLPGALAISYDGVNSWTPNTCCANNIPLAQADISAPVDTKAVDKTPGFKQWNVTSIVQGWVKDRKSTRLNSSHDQISYAVFCLKKKKKKKSCILTDVS